MRVRCNAEDCKYWSESGGDYVYEGGCTLEEISVSDEYVFDSRPGCSDYEPKE